MENYFEVLKLSRDEIEGKDDETIKTLVTNAHTPLYDAALKYTGFGAGDRRDLLNEAKNTLIDPQRREKYLEGLDNLRQAEFINFINLFKATSPTITAEQHSSLLQQAQDDYGLAAKEAEEILKKSGLVVEKPDPKPDSTPVPQSDPVPVPDSVPKSDPVPTGDGMLLHPSIQRVAISGFSVAAIALVTRLIILQFGNSGWLATGLALTDWKQHWRWVEWFEWPWFEWKVYTLSAPGTGLGFVIALASLGAGIFAYWFYFFKKKRVR